MKRLEGRRLAFEVVHEPFEVLQDPFEAGSFRAVTLVLEEIPVVGEILFAVVAQNHLEDEEVPLVRGPAKSQCRALRLWSCGYIL